MRPMFYKSLLIVVVASACTHGKLHSTQTMTIPTPSVQVGVCGEPNRDGVMGKVPRVEHADRDLDGDGRPETIVVDRTMCTGDADPKNCYWNVFTHPAGECARYVGTFAGAGLEPLGSKGEDNMSDVRAYWRQTGNRLLLQSYRFTRGGYQIGEVLSCKRAADDRLECADTVR
ncbi:MAG: hypothetical protein JWO36_5239 [Myxococcales bacterium]|nr:hypothetical protein [Myxococcales bacterium]